VSRTHRGSGHGRPGTSPAFDRVQRDAPQDRRRRDGLGKEALYSTAPTAAPSSQMDLRCRTCRVQLGITVWEAAKLFVPPFVWDPFRRRLWTRCPACGERAWLELRVGQALRVLLDRTPGR
jgi:hypothetical protein